MRNTTSERQLAQHPSSIGQGAELAASLDRQTDLHLFEGRTALAELLAHIAADLRAKEGAP